MKQQLNVRISPSTREKLDELSEHHGTQTEAVAVAIDRLYQAERPKEETMRNRYFRCQFCEATVQGWNASQDYQCCPQQDGHHWIEFDPYSPLVELSGDLHDMQGEVWDDLTNYADPQEFVGDDRGIEWTVDELLTYINPVPEYRMTLTGSTFTARELMVGYLERMTDYIRPKGRRKKQ